MLELDEGQLSRPVLRGRGGSNTSLLPGYGKQARVSPTPNGGARVYAHWHEETWPPDMRIAQDLSISRVRKAGKSLTVRSAARFTRGWSGRTRFGPDRRHESERGQPLSLGGG